MKGFAAHLPEMVVSGPAADPLALAAIAIAGSGMVRLASAWRAGFAKDDMLVSLTCCSIACWLGWRFKAILALVAR